MHHPPFKEITSSQILPSEEGEIPVPQCFVCPLSRHIFINPVLSPSGHTFEKSAIMQHLQSHRTNPITNSPLHPEELYPNNNLMEAIQYYARHSPKLFPSTLHSGLQIQDTQKQPLLIVPQAQYPSVLQYSTVQQMKPVSYQSSRQPQFIVQNNPPLFGQPPHSNQQQLYIQQNVPHNQPNIIFQPSPFFLPSQHSMNFQQHENFIPSSPSSSSQHVHRVSKPVVKQKFPPEIKHVIHQVKFILSREKQIWSDCSAIFRKFSNSPLNYEQFLNLLRHVPGVVMYLDPYPPGRSWITFPHPRFLHLVSILVSLEKGSITKGELGTILHDKFPDNPYQGFPTLTSLLLAASEYCHIHQKIVTSILPSPTLHLTISQAATDAHSASSSTSSHSSSDNLSLSSTEQKPS